MSIPGVFLRISRANQEFSRDFRGVPGVFQKRFRGFQWVSEVLKKFQGRYRSVPIGVSLAYQGSSMGIHALQEFSMGFQGFSMSFSGGYEDFRKFNGFSWGFGGFPVFSRDSRDVPESLKATPGIFKWC